MLYRYLLFVRFLLVNIVAVGLLAGIYLQGWMDCLLSSHLVELSGAISLVFLYGFLLCGAKTWRHSVEMNALKAGTPSPDSRAGQYLAQAGTASR